MHSDVYESIWLEFGVMLDPIKLNIFILVLFILTLIQGHRSARKQKISVAIVSQSFQSIWKEFGILLRLDDMINLKLSLSLPFDIQRREPNLAGFFNTQKKS